MTPDWVGCDEQNFIQRPVTNIYLNYNYLTRMTKGKFYRCLISKYLKSNSEFSAKLSLLCALDLTCNFLYIMMNTLAVCDGENLYLLKNQSNSMVHH